MKPLRPGAGAGWRGGGELRPLFRRQTQCLEGGEALGAVVEVKMGINVQPAIGIANDIVHVKVEHRSPRRVASAG